MRFDVSRHFLPILPALIMAGCQLLPYGGPKQVPVNQAAPPVSQLDAPDETYANQWEAGRAIYVGDQQCARCHQPKPIQEFAIDEWKDKIIVRMSVKARLTSEQTQSLAEYIMAVKRSQLVGTGRSTAKPRTTPVSAADNS